MISNYQSRYGLRRYLLFAYGTPGRTMTCTLTVPDGMNSEMLRGNASDGGYFNFLDISGTYLYYICDQSPFRLLFVRDPVYGITTKHTDIVLPVCFCTYDGRRAVR